MRGLEQIPWLYDLFMSVSERFGLGRWRKLLVERARGEVLEVGCGTGRNLPLYPEGVALVAIEPEHDALLADAQALAQAGAFAVVLAAVNVFGGFLVTQRMLEMFKKKEKKEGN